MQPLSVPDTIDFTGQLRAVVHLVWVAFWRLVRSRQTLISLLLLLFASLVVMAWSLRGERSAAQFLEEIILPLYVSFLLPIFCLCFATPSIAGEREERTLVYLLSTPLPRPMIHAAKFAAAFIASAVWTVGGLVGLCLLAGTSGRETLYYLWPTALWTTLAYVGLFHLLSVTFRRATIIALGYALFLEAFVANVPGIVKRVTISFYAHCSIFAATEPLGMGPTGSRSADLYQPVSGSTALTVFMAASLVLFLLGTWIFSRREYS
jgi:ABC-2 type transport system permease protein